MKLRKKVSNKKFRPYVFVVLFTLVGVAALVAIRAATPTASFEAETNTSATNVTKGTDTSASAGQYLQFGAGQVTPPTGETAGLFITRTDLQRAKTRIAGTAEPFKTVYGIQKSKADGALGSTPAPFKPTATNYTNLKYNWCGSLSERTGSIDGNVDNSLADAVRKLEDQGDTTRALALQYALTGDRRYGDKALQYLKAWAEQSKAVNMHDFELSSSQFWKPKAETSGMCTSDRPFNFMLDGLFQGYGLIGFSDAYILLTQNGYSLGSADNTAIRAYLRSMAEAVNSSFQVWTRYGELQDPNNMRYKADNHLSWSLAYLLSAAAALNDQALANYAVSGGVWNDSRLPNYTNKTTTKSLINLAILSDGRIIDPVQFGRPETYTYFHMYAMNVSSRIAEIHFDQDMWSYKGSDGVGLEKAYATATSRVISGEYSGHAFQYELAYAKWPTSANKSARDKNRTAYITQAYGPVSLLLGQ